VFDSKLDGSKDGIVSKGFSSEEKLSGYSGVWMCMCLCAFSTLSEIFGSSCSALDVQVAFFFLYQIRVQTQVNTNMKTKKKTKKNRKNLLMSNLPPPPQKKNKKK
jgi:hypothetical protein